MENTTLVYMTFPTKADAITVGRELVGHKLAACVNILDQMNSIYHWDGELQYDTEVVMIAKTLASRVPELTEIVKANHSAECPCIITIPVTGGNPDFLAWIAGEVQK